jgi:isoquinoline 1-oxidoreductase beta subunit
MQAISRREFVKLGTMGGAGLVLGISLPVSAQPDGEPVELRPLIHIDRDGQVTVFAQNPDMGQGVKTALPLIIAEELDVDWASISVKQSPWDTRLRNQFSGGSLSIRLNYEAMRQAGASAREMLRQAAAQRWRVPVSELLTRDAAVQHTKTGRLLTYGELVDDAAGFPVPEEPPLKSPGEFRLIGRDAKDVDIVAMLEGDLDYGFDITVPGMLCAVVRRSPWSDGQPKSFDASDVMKGITITMNTAAVLRCLTARTSSRESRSWRKRPGPRCRAPGSSASTGSARKPCLIPRN